jgi:4'-phosphopantetheinyl transferase
VSVATIRRPATVPELLAGEAHVWQASLDRPRGELARLASTLSADELERADRFATCELRDRFVAGRGILRELLARYVRLPADSLRFEYGLAGKPELAWPEHGLRFNLSHSRGVAAYAVTGGARVGVDVEETRNVKDLDGVASLCFSARERATLRRLPARAREPAFFACWTRKEAYLKALGDGLTVPLEDFDVAFAPGEAAALLHVAGDAGAPARWSLVDLDAGAGFAGALAVEQAGCVVVTLRWPG